MTDHRPWVALTGPDEVADALVALFDERGHEPYDEAVSQTVHGVQAALLAVAEGAPNDLVVAALLHDVAHLFEPPPHDGEHPAQDFRHEVVAARFLGNWFGTGVTEPIRHHVDAKRFLCAVDQQYFAVLSPASVHSLALQGGVMSPDEVEEFLTRPGSHEAVLLRRWDDRAKNPDLVVPPLSVFRDRLAHAVTAASGDATV